MNKNRRSEKTAPQLLSIALAVVLFTGLWLAAVYLSASLQSRSVTAETRSGVYDGNGNELKTNEELKNRIENIKKKINSV